MKRCEKLLIWIRIKSSQNSQKVNQNVNQLIKSHYNFNSGKVVGFSANKKDSDVFHHLLTEGFLLWLLRFMWYEKERERENGIKFIREIWKLASKKHIFISLWCIVVSIIICKQIKTDNIKFGFHLLFAASYHYGLGQ